MLKVLAALAQDQSSALSTHIKRLTTCCNSNSNSRGYDSQPLQVPTHIHVPTNRHSYRHINKKEIDLKMLLEEFEVHLRAEFQSRLSTVKISYRAIYPLLVSPEAQPSREYSPLVLCIPLEVDKCIVSDMKPPF